MEIAHISADTNTRWTYRVGSPDLISHPFETELLQSFPQWEREEFRQYIHKTLKDAGVEVLWTHLVKHVRAGIDVEDTPITLSIDSDLSVDGQYACWVIAAASLRCLLDASGLEQVLVEITDRRAARHLDSRRPRGCTPDFISRWQSFIPILLAAIEDRDWLAIDIVSREFGVSSPFTVPTIVITTKDADNEIWRQRIIPRLRTHLPSSMDIDIVYASTLSYTASSEDEIKSLSAPLYSTMEEYLDCVRAGSSTGLDHSPNSATIGAAIILSDSNGNETSCGLTNHHVVAKEGSLIYENCPIGHSLGPDNPVCRDGLVKLVCPSHPDHERFVTHTRNGLKSSTASLAYLEKNCRQETPFYAYFAERVPKYQADLKKLHNNPNRLLGTVWATSGYRVCNKAGYSSTDMMDFSSVDKERDKDMPCLQTLIDGRTLSFGLNWALVKLAENRGIVGVPYKYTRIEPNKTYPVLKKGRTTNWTEGTISRIGSLLNIRKDDVNVMPVDLRGRFGETNGVMLAYGIFNGKKSGYFMESGDSGSCVMLAESGTKFADDNEIAVGLLFASNEWTRVSYMIPMDLVIQDIEDVTGHTVIVPKFVEYADGFSAVTPDK
ncbi:hypothetical protein PTT_18188 [Pyrenophora teres f. teres 0-1]|uniref:Uncharacterized protein n=1 Tax=Pyrenophora teres f. teres (strain 0-1) TaxID=861557 RepID=E3S668_PYRTT|nr:hypothetical protein PTT_18188 [Pyrenophora teres f. teres 0-1]